MTLNKVLRPNELPHSDDLLFMHQANSNYDLYRQCWDNHIRDKYLTEFSDVLDQFSSILYCPAVVGLS